MKFVKIILLYLVFMCTSIPNSNSIKLPKYETKKIPQTYKSVEDSLYNFLINENVKYPEQWTKLAILESGWNLESDVAKNGNNLFGFICVNDTNRNIGCYNGHSKYRNWKHCIEDLKLWINMSKPYKYEDFYMYLRRRKFNTVNENYYILLKNINFTT